MVESAIFWVFAVVSISAALVAVLSRSIIHAALGLIAVFMSIAGFFLLNNADFLAIAQIIIYAVGLTIILLFAIMFTGDKPAMSRQANMTAKVVSGVVLFYFGALLFRAMSIPVKPSTGPMGELAGVFAQQGSTTLLGNLLFSSRGYALPFELASVLLLAAMIGAIVIAKKRFVEVDAAMTGSIHFEVDPDSAPPEEAIAALRAKRLTSLNEDLSGESVDHAEASRPHAQTAVGTLEKSENKD